MSKRLGSRETVARNSLVYTAASILQKMSSLLLLPVYTRIMDPYEFGYMNLIVTFVLFMSVFVLGGLDHVVMRYCSGTASESGLGQRYFTACFVSVGVGSVIVLAMLTSLQSVYVGIVFPGLAFWPVIALASTSLLFQPMFSLVLSLMQARSDARTYSALSVGYFLSNAFLTVLLVGSLQQGLLGISLSYLIANSAFAIVGVVYAARRGFIGRCPSWSMYGDIFGYSLPLVPHNVSLQATALALRVIVARGTSVALLGIFNIAMYVVNFVDAVQTALHRAYLPWFFEEAEARSEGWQQRVTAMIVGLIAVNVVMCTSVSLFAREAMAAVATDAYLGAWEIVPLLALSMMAKSLYYPSLGALLFRASGTRFVFLVSAISSGAGVVAAFILVGSIGLWGAAIAQLLQRVSMVLLSAVFAARVRLAVVPWFRAVRVQGIGVLAIVLGWAIDHCLVERWSILAIAGAKLILLLGMSAALVLVEPMLMTILRRSLSNAVR